jgi:transcriptional regulator with XRE-family HTH domain
MNSSKLKRLKAAGWKVGTTPDFLGLQEQEAALVEVKLSLIDAVKKSRQKRRLSQVDLAERIGSSQSRVAKIEAGDPSVSLDLIARALIATGATQKEILTTFTVRQPLARYEPDNGPLTTAQRKAIKRAQPGGRMKVKASLF